MNIIGHISTDFPTKFGIPRQSGLIEELKGVITYSVNGNSSKTWRESTNGSVCNKVTVQTE